MSAEVFRQTIQQPSDRVIVALDRMNWEQASTVMGEVGPYVGMGKANALAQKKGWEHAVNTIAALGAYTMADAKYKDIPETMENHLREVTECAPQLVTIHGDNSKAALESAVVGRDAGKEELAKKPDLYERGLPSIQQVAGILGITVLTSIDGAECRSIYGGDPEDSDDLVVKKKVMQFAHTALEAGLDGIVCSGKELEAIRAVSELDALLTVVPGINPEWAAKPEDQKRVVTPSMAVQLGADFIVVGRAITKPPEGISRTEAAQRIAQELQEA